MGTEVLTYSQTDLPPIDFDFPIELILSRIRDKLTESELQRFVYEVVLKVAMERSQNTLTDELVSDIFSAYAGLFQLSIEEVKSFFQIPEIQERFNSIQPEYKERFIRLLLFHAANTELTHLQTAACAFEYGINPEVLPYRRYTTLDEIARRQQHLSALIEIINARKPIDLENMNIKLD